MSFFKSCFIVLYLFCVGFVRSQSTAIVLIKEDQYKKELVELSKAKVKVKKRGIGNALLSFYQNRISALISADCIYQLSCSRYSREAINKYGLTKGILLTADRLTRCSFPCSKEIPDYKFNEEGLAQDNP